MFPLMVFMFLFFLGFIALFFYILRHQERCFKQLSEEHAQLRVLLRALESRLDHMAGENTKAASDSGAEAEKTPENDPEGYDPLLRLNFEEQPKGAHDPALELNIIDIQPGSNQS